MTHLKYLLIFFMPFILLSCKSSDSSSPTPAKTGVELIVLGASNFGNVVIGQYRETIVQVNNYDVAIKNFAPTMVAPFSVSKISAPCNSGTINTNDTCQITVRYTPTVKGTYKDSLIVGSATQAFTGNAVSNAGVVQYSVASWNLGDVLAGDQNTAEVTLTNAGDFTVHTPVIAAVEGYTLSYNACGDYIATKKSCLQRYSIVKKTLGSQTDSITFSAIDSTTYTITSFSHVLPGPAFGGIVMINVPSTMIANGNDIETIATAPIMDQYNNIVSDGTVVNVVVTDNLLIPGASGITTATYKTVGGVISFKVQSRQQKGEADITLTSASASGFKSLNLISGLAVGTITAGSYITQTEANGVAQIDISINALTDSLGFVVENGSPVYVSTDKTVAQGSGTIINKTLMTISGQATVSIKAPTVTGTTVITVYAGDHNGAAPCGWSACGSFTVKFVPGLATGTIAMTSSQSGIYADPSSGLAATPPEIIQSNITFGPVVDQYNNIVTTGSNVQVNLTNAIGVYDNTSGKSSFTVTTDSSGMGKFSIQAIGTRGYVVMQTSKDLASGSTQIWAYNNVFIRPDSPGLPTNPFKLYMSFNDSSTVPQPTANWGLVKTWANLDIQDKNYFGDVKKSGPPTLMPYNLPYLATFCLFSAGNTVYGSNCYQDNFLPSSIYSLIKITKSVNETGGSVEPGASTMTTATNNPRSVDQIHQVNVAGCYKQDSTVGSPTNGQYIYYPEATQANCNALNDDNDNTSPVYLNSRNPWFNGAWRTDLYYPLKYPVNAMIPDLSRSLIFGGYYEIPKMISQSANALHTEMSNRHTWVTGYGQDTPYVWTEDQNGDKKIYGDYPSPVVIPTVTSAGTDLYMFGGLNLIGDSNDYNGNPVTDYVSSTGSNDLQVFKGATSKWTSLSPGSDNTITQPTNSNTQIPTSPEGRYQHGMVYIPDNDTLFVAGGVTKGYNSNGWSEPNDMWSIKNISSSVSNLSWSRKCLPCGFPIGVHNPSAPVTPSTLSPSPVKMVYNPYLQKVFMLWSGNNVDITNFNPLSTSTTIQPSTTNNYSFASIQGSDLFDMEVNQASGRTYFYKRGTKGAMDSKMYYWDMDPGMKQFMKIDVELGTEAKVFARSISVHVRGYGTVKDQNYNLLTNGLEVYIYNYTTSAWVLVGTNTAQDSTSDTDSQAITNTFNATSTGGTAQDFINSSGRATFAVAPRDIININTNAHYVGQGFNTLKIDEFYINGLF